MKILRDTIGSPCNLPTGIEESTLQGNINIYPNPTNNLVHINTGSENILTIKLFNLHGELIQEYFTNDFSVSNLTDGVYFINIQTSKTSYTNKLIKQP
jgi:hypothetical protein